MRILGSLGSWRRFLVALLLGSASLSASGQTPADAKGDWHGTLKVGTAGLRVVLHLGDASTFDSLDQSAFGLPAHFNQDGRHLVVTMEKLAVFDGDLSEDAQTLTGTLKQGANAIPLVFERGVFVKPVRPQMPTKPYPYREEEVGYDNPARPGVHLAGTLTVPNGAGRFPAVVLITGSGAQDRDETIFDHKPFLVLADYLTRRGIAVLRVDDRGRGGSTGATVNDTTADYATDVRAGVAFLRTRPDIDAKRIGLIGHSEGGEIAPMVAKDDPAIAFLVLWAGPGVTGLELVVEQVRINAVAAGAPPTAVQKATALERAILEAVSKAADAASAQAAVRKVRSDNGLPDAPQVSLDQLTVAWYRYFLTYDPAPALRAVKAPVLALLGSKDVQVSAAQNATVLRATLAGNPAAKVVELPGLNHLFQRAGTGAVAEYDKIEETIAPIALTTIGDWIAERVK